LHWTGLRVGSTLTRVISLAVGIMLMVLVVGCFLTPAAVASAAPPPAASAVTLPLMSLGMLAAVVTALRAVSAGFRAWGSAVEVTRPLQDGGELELRDRTLRVLHRPGHSPSDTVFFDEQRAILLSADHLIAHISSNPLLARHLGTEPDPAGPRPSSPRPTTSTSACWSPMPDLPAPVRCWTSRWMTCTAGSPSTPSRTWTWCTPSPAGSSPGAAAASC